LNSASLKKIFWVTGATLFVAGLFGWGDRLLRGHLDANYGSIVTWGLWVAAYLFFAGMSAGCYVISALPTVFKVKKFEPIARLALFSSVITILLALLLIWADLGHMLRAVFVLIFANFNSPMTWMVWLYTLFLIVTLAQLWLSVRSDLDRGKNSTRTRDLEFVGTLSYVGLPLAVLFPVAVGVLFGSVVARPYWNSGLMPVLFFLSGVVTGTAALTVVAAIFQDGWRRQRDVIVSLGQIVLWLLLIDLFFQASEFFIAIRSNVPGHLSSVQLVMSGPFWWVFWFGQLVIGTVVPLWILLSANRREPRWVSLAGLFVVLGIFAFRLNVVIPGLAAEELRGIASAITSPRLTAHYIPSWMEWLVTLGVVGLGMLLFGIGEHYLPKNTETGGLEKESTHVRA
jgi:molybdopterin-containing oxidoreductase family membrane subunit